MSSYLGYKLMIDADGKLFCQSLELYGFSTVRGLQSAIAKKVERTRNSQRKQQQVRGR